MRSTVSFANRRRALRRVGFWCSHEEPGLPDPRDHIDSSWSVAERDRTLRYLDSAPYEATVYMGWSECRLCGAANGTRDLTDGTFVFPEGFAHYLRDHCVRPSEGFLTHLRGAQYELPSLSEYRVDDQAAPMPSTIATVPARPIPRSANVDNSEQPKRRRWWYFGTSRPTSR